MAPVREQIRTDDETHPGDKSGVYDDGLKGIQSSWDADNSDYKDPSDKVRSRDDDSSEEDDQDTSLAGKEESASTDDGSDSAAVSASEENSLGYSSGDGASDSEGLSRFQRFKANASKKRALAGFGIAGSIVGLIGVGSILSGPFKIIHAGQMLRQTHLKRNENDSNIRTSRIIRMLRSKDTKNLRLGSRARKYADKWDAKIADSTGLKSIYHPDTGRFVGYEVLDEDKARTTLKDLEKDGVKPRDGGGTYDFGDGSPKTTRNRIVDLGDTKFKNRRSVIRSVVRGSDVNDVSGAVASRVLQRLGGVDFHPIKNIRRKITDNIVEWYSRTREERAKRNANGVEAPNARAPDTDSDGDGTGDSTDTDPSNNTPNEADNAASAAAGEVIDEVDGLDTPSAPRGSTKFMEQLKSIRNSTMGKAASGVAAVVGILCAVKSIGNAIEAVQYANTILPLVRMGILFVTAGSQIQANQASMDEIGVLYTDLYEEIPSGQTAGGLTSFGAINTLASITGNKRVDFTAADTWLAASGKQPTGGFKLPEEAQPSKAGEKPQLFEIIDSIPGLPVACNINDAIGNLPIIKQVGAVASGAMEAVLSKVGLSPTVLVGKVVNFLAGAGVNLLARGPELGNILMYGVRIAGNMANVAAGALDLNDTEEAQLRVRDREIAMEEQQFRPLASRLFDLNDISSLSGRIAFQMPTSIQGAFSSLASLPSGLFAAFQPQVYAAAIPYPYGFNLIGTSKADMNSEIFTEVEENAKIVESGIKYYSDNYMGCFANGITPDLELVKNDLARADVLPKFGKCADRSDDMKRYIAYLQLRTDENALTCPVGEDEACDELGFGSGSGSSSDEPVSTSNEEGSTSGGSTSANLNSPAPTGSDTQVIDGFTVYKQYDPAWGGNTYGVGGRTIASSGCGPTAMAMIITSLTGQTVTPADTAAYGMKAGTHGGSAGGSNGVALATKMAANWGLKAEFLGANKQAINAALDRGALVIVSGNGSQPPETPFSQGGHFVVIRGRTADGKWLVGDSSHRGASPDTSTVGYDPDTMVKHFSSGGYSSYAISK